MSPVAWIDGARIQLAPAQLLGQGGEAEVYDLGDGRVLKWWKPADHPDFEGLPHARAAAIQRLAEQPAKLRALPGRLPVGVVAPCGVALGGKRSAEVVGYVMPKVLGTPLLSYGEPRWRRDHPIEGAELVAVLLALHDAIAGLHHAGVVIGDCNDLNVLVDGRRAHLIDVDSYQYGGYVCSMFSERFVDPRLCDAELVPVRPHDADSDWFAFAVMAFRSLVNVGPWGGVHKQCAAGGRALRRLSVLGAEVVYPRAARPLAILPDGLLETFRKIFEGNVRGPFPRGLLESLRLRKCSACGDEHARLRCPSCQAIAHVPPAIVQGRLRWHTVSLASIQLGSVEVPHAARAVGDDLNATALARRSGNGPQADSTALWIAGDALMRQTRLGPERIGSVLAGQTRAWAGGRLGVGFYRAGGYAVGFVFRPDRGVLDDRVALPRIRGQLVDAWATVGDDRAWLWLTCAHAGRITTTCIVIAADTSVIATETIHDAPWLAGIAGACAAGPQLFVPTDDGIARIEVVQGTIAQTRVFAETSTLIGAGDRLAIDTHGLAALRAHDAIRMQLT